MNDPELIKFELLSIDAWRDQEGWQWNSWHRLEKDIFIAESELTPRKILKTLRKWDYLSTESKGRMAIEDDGYNLVVENKDTGEPVLALCYGEFM